MKTFTDSIDRGREDITNRPVDSKSTVRLSSLRSIKAVWNITRKSQNGEIDQVNSYDGTHAQMISL